MCQLKFSLKSETTFCLGGSLSRP